jgi:hypothetical protein
VNTATGELVCGRCRATNLCPYCRALYVVETVEMVVLDALEDAPTIYAVLTAREHLTRAQCRRHLDHVRRRVLCRRWPVEWFVTVEFQRRGALHLNLSIKGVPVDQVDELRTELVGAWCSRVDAEPIGQWVEPMRDAGGVIAYMAKMLAHGLKQEQQPPTGWPGHRTSQTRGYLVRPASVMRREARRSLAIKRLIWAGWDGATAELEVDARAQEAWRLTRVRPSSSDIAAPVPGVRRWADTGRAIA